MYFVQFSFALYVLCLSSCLALEDEQKNKPETNPDRTGRKVVTEYQPPDKVTDNSSPPYRPSVRALSKSNYMPYKHAGSGVMKKSGANLNWSVWKGDDDGSSPDSSDEGSPWNNDAWAVDPLYLMALKNAMGDIKGDSKPQGFLSKLGSDPALLLIAASIPISLLLAAVLPTLVNMWMNGSNVPMVTTTATGNTGRNYEQLDILPYLTPVMEAIGTFGAKSISNPDCMQRIFCEIAQDKIPLQEANYLKRAATFARYLSDGHWLESFGVKDLVDSFGSGKCENIPCSHDTKLDGKNLRNSRKVDEDQ